MVQYATCHIHYVEKQHEVQQMWHIMRKYSKFHSLGRWAFISISLGSPCYFTSLQYFPVEPVSRKFNWNANMFCARDLAYAANGWHAHITVSNLLHRNSSWTIFLRISCGNMNQASEYGHVQNAAWLQCTRAEVKWKFKFETVEKTLYDSATHGILQVLRRI